MGSVVAILMILVAFKAICGLWLLVSAYKASIGSFLFMVFLFFGGSVLFGQSGLGALIILGASLVFVVKNWQEVRTPFLLLVAASVIETVVVRQAAKTIAEQDQQAAVQQAR